MSSSLSCCYSPVMGYASLALKDSGLSKLNKYFQKIPFETEIVGEDIYPTAECRPVWNEVLELIERQALTTLVIPSLLHVAGDDFTSLANFLSLLRLKGVRLKSLAEGVDSSRLPGNEILAAFAENNFNTKPRDAGDTRGAL
jgi:DNA invertase Pin-like site-specific DNA recombinase